jgi:sporulation protein YlmC with PRC-barrel domain
MKRFHLRLSMSMMGIATLAACSSIRTSGQVTPPAPPTPVVPIEAPPAPPQPGTAVEPNEARPDAAAVPACSCVDANANAKRKLKPRPKPPRKEAPPQLPTAPVVAEAAPGGVVDAQVRSMNVPVTSILGKRVQGPNGEDLGRVVDVLADASGRVRVAIIDFGGFLGVGDRRIAVDWPLLRFSPDRPEQSLLLSVSREKLRTAPEYNQDPLPRTLVVPPTPTPAAPAPAPGPTAAPTESKK